MIVKAANKIVDTNKDVKPITVTGRKKYVGVLNKILVL